MEIIKKTFIDDLYNADVNGRKAILKRLQGELNLTIYEAEKVPVYIKIATACGYIDGQEMLDDEEAIKYWEKVLISPASSEKQIAWARIQKCNLIRRKRRLEEAVASLKALDLKKIEKNTRILFEYYWVLGVCSSHDRIKYQEYTLKAREIYELIPEEERDMICIDKFICTGVWLGPQKYRQGIDELWSGDELKAQACFNSSEEMLQRSLDDCKEFGAYSRIADPLIHLSFLYAFGKREYDKAWYYLGEAGKTGAWYVAEFTKIITPKCLIGWGIETPGFGEMNLGTNPKENEAWWWASKVELPRAQVRLIKQKYANKPKELKKKVLAIVPMNYDKGKYPPEIMKGIKLVIKERDSFIA